MGEREKGTETGIQEKRLKLNQDFEEDYAHWLAGFEHRQTQHSLESGFDHFAKAIDDLKLKFGRYAHLENLDEKLKKFAIDAFDALEHQFGASQIADFIKDKKQNEKYINIKKYIDYYKKANHHNYNFSVQKLAAAGRALDPKKQNILDFHQGWADNLRNLKLRKFDGSLVETQTDSLEGYLTSAYNFYTGKKPSAELIDALIFFDKYKSILSPLIGSPSNISKIKADNLLDKVRNYEKKLETEKHAIEQRNLNSPSKEKFTQNADLSLAKQLLEIVEKKPEFLDNHLNHLQKIDIKTLDMMAQFHQGEMAAGNGFLMAALEVRDGKTAYVSEQIKFGIPELIVKQGLNNNFEFHYYAPVKALFFKKAGEDYLLLRDKPESGNKEGKLKMMSLVEFGEKMTMAELQTQPDIMRIHETVRQGTAQEHLLHHYNIRITTPPSKKGLLKSSFEISPNPQAILRFSEDKPRRKSEPHAAEPPKKQHTKHHSR